MNQLNIIVAGKSGVGKSSLLNYLVGKDIFETGIGEPVTQEYFNNHTYTSPENGVRYCLYDTKGIEPSTTDEFLSEIYGKIEAHDALGDIFDSIHTVYYCLAASSKRAEDFEIEFILELSECTSVVILLTKSDQVTENEIIDLKEYLNKSLDAAIQIVPVCSVESRTRKGTSSPFGKEDILKHSFLGLWNKLAKILPEKLYPIILNSINIPLSIEKKLDFLKQIGTIEQSESYFKQIGTISLDDINLKGKERRTKHLWDRHYKKKLGLKSSDQLFLIQLFNLPKLENLKLNVLDIEDLEILENFTNVGLLLLENIQEKIIVVINDYKEVCKLEQMRVLDFYSQLKKEKIIFATSFKANNELKRICSNLTNDIVPELNKQLILIKRDINLVKNSNTTLEWIFNTDHRNNLRDSYRTLREFGNEHGSRIEEQLTQFSGIFEAELHQYGQLVIKNNDEIFDRRIGLINSQRELSSDENTYFKVLIKNKTNNKIMESERAVLDSLRETLFITYDRAGCIEDFCNQEMEKVCKSGGVNA